LPDGVIVEPKRFYDLRITPGVIFKHSKTAPWADGKKQFQILFEKDARKLPHGVIFKKLLK
jgi:hypothetical protein